MLVKGATGDITSQDISMCEIYPGVQHWNFTVSINKNSQYIKSISVVLSKKHWACQTLTGHLLIDYLHQYIWTSRKKYYPIARNSKGFPETVALETIQFGLTYLPLDQMVAILQTIFWDACLWMKSFVFWLKFHWNLFLRVQLSISQHWFR